MTLKELLRTLQLDDFGEQLNPNAPVVFDTEFSFDMELLSVYEKDGTIHIDIG